MGARRTKCDVSVKHGVLGLDQGLCTKDAECFEAGVRNKAESEDYNAVHGKMRRLPEYLKKQLEALSNFGNTASLMLAFLGNCQEALLLSFFPPLSYTPPPKIPHFRTTPKVLAVGRDSAFSQKLRPNYEAEWVVRSVGEELPAEFSPLFAVRVMLGGL
ncbi:hypothetical protein B0H12DRAFT_1082440 [Mycena haematopus]|nr:hypothetical protein B0H12DRAFT_1082440 [Mycena haematopus]